MWKLWLSGLRAHWVEAVLGVVVVAVSVATLTVQRSVSASAEGQVHDLAHHLGKNMLVVPAGTNLTDFYSMRYGSETMPDSTPDQIRSSAIGRHIKSIQARLYGNVAVDGNDLISVGERNWRGRAAFSRVPAGKAMLGNEAGKRLGIGAGDTLELNRVPLAVSQVTTTPPDGLDVGVFTALATGQRVLNQPHAVNALRLGGCWCKVDVPTLASQVEDIIP
ncbi:MAG: hypothetical protein GXP54_01865, partial [Deltaproteobacteria bacterium]|nr:hypothetical protein [Deltaproteobacteria bacterium]